MPQLSDTRVLVTGGTSGLGLAMAQALAQAGARVALPSRRRERAQATAEALGAGALGLGLDVREPLRVSPYKGAEHRYLHVMTKVNQTPPRFPRRDGVARKRPLGRA